MRCFLMLGALLLASAASAQELPRVWRDADLMQPLPQLHRKADPAIVEAFRARADQPAPSGALPLGAGGVGQLQPPQERPSAPPPAKDWHAAEAGRPYAAQPLYPYLAVIYSGRPLLGQPAPNCPRPIVVQGRLR